jgi:uncharacterized membrane protein YciS (DUF1049 family)
MITVVYIFGYALAAVVGTLVFFAKRLEREQEKNKKK